MRIRRISLRDFRGVQELTVDLDPAGVTVVQGPNESGKTSIADAFVLLLDYKDSSSSRAVRDAQPVGRDVGPFAEAELSVGPYRLLYRKQWLRGRRTELQITEPQREQLTGEEAHNRVAEILEDETDPALFRALRYQQGVAISQAALAGSPSLLAALDAAAGGRGAALGSGDGLLHRVREERLRYFTEKGALPAARKAKAEQVSQLQDEAAALEDRIRDMDQAAERQLRIEGELIELRRREPQLAQQVAESREAMRAIEALRREMERTEHLREQGESALREAGSARERRAQLVASAAAAADAVAAQEAEIAAAGPALTAAGGALTDAQRSFAQAEEAVAAAERNALAGRAIVDAFELRLAIERLQGRHGQLVAAERTVESAERFLAGCALEEKLLGEIDVAADALAVARGRADAGRPRVELEALRPLRVSIGGRERDAVPGVPIEEVVDGELEALIADVARVRVHVPQPAAETEAALAEARRRLQELLELAQVDSQAAAHGLARERTGREAELRNAIERRTEVLDGLQPAQLAAELERARVRLQALEREHDLPAPSGSEEPEGARAALAEAEAHLARERAARSARQADLSAAQEAMRELQDANIRRHARLESSQSEAGRLAEELRGERAQAPDEQLQRGFEQARERLRAAAAASEQAARSLAAADPDSAQAVLGNAESLQQRLLADIAAGELELATTRAQLELAGHEGLSTRLSDARARLEDLRRQVDSEERRAAAVALLHDVLTEKREQAQKAYVGPFGEKLNAYARILYGSEVEVAIDHRTLQVASRTMNGSTVGFASLSGGAREQLAVLSRLACAALVSPAAADGAPGGVPVIIDDALGYSDPERLQRLGAAIRVAGRDCQVILLTCEPGRYRDVGGATVVCLS